MKYYVSILLLFLTCTGFSQQPAIVTPSWLAAQMEGDNFKIIHVGSEKDYDEGHLPGAQYMNAQSFVYTEGHGPKQQMYDLPELSTLQALLRSHGIEANSKLLLYPGGTSHLAVTRLLFTFHYLGFGGRVSILSGGKPAWVAAGFPMSREVPDITPSKLKLNPDQSLLVNKAQVVEALESEIRIVDCRAKAYYTGVDINEMHGKRPGHMPGAKSIPYTDLFERSDQGYYQFVSLEQIGKLFEQQGLKKDDDIILYCHIGLQLTSVFTAAQDLGYTNVKVYDGSFHEYGPDTSLPVTTD